MNPIKEKEIEKLLKSSMIHRAPDGMVDRIMANIAVQPKRITSIKPIEPNPIIATSLVLLTFGFLALAFIIKPDAWSSIPWNIVPRVDFNISSLWIAPIAIVTAVVWGYIMLSKNASTDTAHHY